MDLPLNSPTLLPDEPGDPPRRIERSLASACGHAAVFVENDVHAAGVDKICPEGISLTLPVPLTEGAAVAVKVFTLSRRYLWTRPLRVLHSAARAEGGYLVGCEFVTPLSAGQIQALLG